MLKMDLHIHSQYSEDATGSPREIMKILKKKGLNGMAITDHNSVKGSLAALKLKTKDFVIISGQEISTIDGHLLAFGINEDLKKNLTVEESVDYILDEGGVPVVPHLFRKMSGIKKKNLELIYKKVPAMEVFNGCSLPKTNKKTVIVAKEFGLGGIGGSDAHNPLYVGYGYTIIKTDSTDVDTILEEIKKKRTWGTGSTIPLQIRRDRMLKSIKQFFQRGFKRI
jgi:predicted metal-dependent phosphoesterase TrpH